MARAGGQAALVHANSTITAPPIAHPVPPHMVKNPPSARLVATSGDLMTLEEAAVAAGVSVRTLARYRASGLLEVTRVGRRVYCTLDAVRTALVRPPADEIGRLVLDPGPDLSLDEWWNDAIRLAEAHPNLESAERLRNLATASERLYPGMGVRHFTVGLLREVDELVGRPAADVDLIRILEAFPPGMAVVDALADLRDRFGW